MNEGSYAPVPGTFYARVARGARYSSIDSDKIAPRSLELRFDIYETLELIFSLCSPLLPFSCGVSASFQ